MSYCFGQISQITQSATVGTQKLQTAEGSISQIQQQAATISNKLQFNPKYWSYLNKLQSGVGTLLNKLSSAKDQAKLIKIQRSSILEDNAIIISMSLFLISIPIIMYYKNS